jgi:hypothetical protein
MLAGVAPIPASSGQVSRMRVNRDLRARMASRQLLPSARLRAKGPVKLAVAVFSIAFAQVRAPSRPGRVSDAIAAG